MDELTYSNKAKAVDYHSHDCETIYRCPYCENETGFFVIDNGPHTRIVRHDGFFAHVYECKKCGKTIWFY